MTRDQPCLRGEPKQLHSPLTPVSSISHRCWSTYSFQNASLSAALMEQTPGRPHRRDQLLQQKPMVLSPMEKRTGGICLFQVTHITLSSKFFFLAAREFLYRREHCLKHGIEWIADWILNTRLQLQNKNCWLSSMQLYIWLCNVFPFPYYTPMKSLLLAGRPAWP